MEIQFDWSWLIVPFWPPAVLWFMPPVMRIVTVAIALLAAIWAVWYGKKKPIVAEVVEA